MRATKTPFYDKDTVIAAAANQWPEILAAVGGFDSAILDGRHHPCPRCGGTDRFRLIDEAAGAVLCNQCFHDGCGDGIAAVQWNQGVDFPEALRRIALHLGVTPAKHTANGKRPKQKVTPAAKEKTIPTTVEVIDPAEHLKFNKRWNRNLARLFCLVWKKGITESAMLACGAKLASYYSDAVFAFPVKQPTPSGSFATVGWHVCNVSGRLLPAFEKDNPKPVDWVKSKLTFGSAPGFIGPIEKLSSAKIVWKLEGVSDLLSFMSLSDRPSDVIAITNGSGAGETPQPWMLEQLTGKAVRVLHDSDVAGERGAAGYSDSAGRHHPGWVERIAPHAAECRHVRLPYPIRKAGEKGPNDLRDWVIEGHGYHDFDELARAEADKPEEQTPGDIKFIADTILSAAQFAQDSGGQLYRYSEGVYKPRAKDFIKREVKRLCLTLELAAKWKTRLADEVFEFIRVDSPELWERPPLDVVNVKNGLLDLTSGELREHSSDHLTTIRLPVTYDPAATCPALEKFVHETFPDDAADLAWEIVAWLMVPDLSIQKAVLLVGEGGNGKSRYLAAVQAFLGKSNTSGLSLHKLESDRFAVARMIGRLANICPDLPTGHLESTSIFKAITGGDTLMAEYKFHDSFEFQPFARLVFSANHLPQSQDGSHGFFRRWLVVPFDRTFSPAEQIDQATLDARLSTEAEFSGLLNKAIEARRRLNRQRAFSEPKSVVAAATDFRATTDPLAVWLDLNTTMDPDKKVAKGALRAAYNEAAKHDGRPMMGQTAFGLAFKRLRPRVGEGQPTINGKVVWAYLGLDIKSPPPDSSRGSRGSLSSPLLVSRTREDGDREENEGETVTGDEIEQDRANCVNRVNGVNGCEHEWVDSPTEDGWIGTTCKHCQKFLGYRPAEAQA